MGEQKTDLWTPIHPDIEAAMERLADATSRHVHDPGFHRDPVMVDTVMLDGLSVYSTLQTDEHADDDFPPWTVLLVLRSEGHILTTEDGSRVMTLKAGDMVTFPLHETHVLDLPPEADALIDERGIEHPEIMARLCAEFPFVAVNLDLEDRPTREQAEGLMVARLAPALECSLGSRGGP